MGTFASFQGFGSSVARVGGGVRRAEKWQCEWGEVATEGFVLSVFGGLHAIILVRLGHGGGGDSKDDTIRKQRLLAVR